MKKKRYLALTLAGLLCVGLLSACGSDTGNESGTEESPLESASATPTPEDSSTGETGGLVETLSYSAGMVLSVDGSQLTLQCYTPADGSSEAALTDATHFILSDYVLSQDIVTITVDDESLLHGLEDNTGGSLAVSNLMPGNILLWQQDSDTGALTDVVLQNTGAGVEIQLAQDMGKSVQDIKNIIAGLHEFNPMMGHRGCRLAVTYPEIAVMQTKAVIKAALNVQAKHPEWHMVPEIMIPLVGEIKELKYVKSVVVATADEIIKAAGSDMTYKVGTMIEIPRAALTADEIAKEAEFFSFGTNDLTQMTFGFSRDDAGKFLDAYYEKKIYESDPFARLDQTGVGRLVEMACKLGRQTRPDLKLGICGEHGGDPSSVEFCHNTGLDYVSCSPFRVPIARLAAAQAAIKNPRK